MFLMFKNNFNEFFLNEVRYLILKYYDIFKFFDLLVIYSKKMNGNVDSNGIVFELEGSIIEVLVLDEIDGDMKSLKVLFSFKRSRFLLFLGEILINVYRVRFKERLFLVVFKLFYRLFQIQRLKSLERN